MLRLRLLVAFGIALLVAVNLSLDIVLSWYIERRLWGGDWVARVTTGVLLCHTLLLGIWLGLSDNKWYWRLAATIPLTLCLAKALSVGSALAHRGRIASGLDWQVVATLFIAIVLTVFVLLLPLRTLRNWRLSWRLYSVPSATQFTLRDLLLWMIPVGCALIAVKFVASLDESGGGGLIELTIYTAGIAAVVWTAMLAAFAGRQRMVALSYTVAFTLLIGGGYGIAAAFRYIQRMYSIYNGKLPPTYVPETLKELLVGGLTIVVPALLALANFAALRALGCKLIRPGQA